EPTIFRLPKVIEATKQGTTVFVVEGEKDVLSMEKLGYVATCNSGGACKWRESFGKHFSGSRVIILPDNDDRGREHARLVASALKETAAEIRILDLPNLPPKGDVSDWIESGGTRDKLESLVGNAMAVGAWLAAHNVLPIIQADCQDLRVVTAECWDAICQANVKPKFFRYTGIPSRLEKDDEGLLVPRELTTDRLRHELARLAVWVHGKDGEVSKPPLDVVRDLLATPNPPLPVLTRITDVPVFAPDGTLQTDEGYHPAGKTYRMSRPGLKIPDIPSVPSPEDVDAAKSLILDMISDFPFVDEADRAHAVGLLLLPFVRDLIDGPTPNHLIEAPQAGTGKGLLADVLLTPACGKHVASISEARDDDEWRKRITAQLRSARSVVLLDNITRPLNSGSLASALTAIVWEDRLLGKSENLHIPVRCVWVTTANNPTMSTEIARRCIRIRLDAKVDRPWFRDGFKQKKLRNWALANRGELVGAALMLVQAWVCSGMPASDIRPLGSYEQWTAIVGGILQHAGIPGFLSNLLEFYEAADIEGAMWRQIVDAWWEKFGSEKVGVNDLFDLVSEIDTIDLGKGGERSQKTVLGRRLGQQRDRVIGEYRIVSAGKCKRISQWMLAPTQNLFSGDDDMVYVEHIGAHSHTIHHAHARADIHAHTHVDCSENVHQSTQCTPSEQADNRGSEDSTQANGSSPGYEEF
ncbi:MAG: toprim domain-containing protein, partial [Armatimonadota bacterium]